MAPIDGQPLVALNGRFAPLDALGVLRQAHAELGDRLAMVSSFGADSAVLLHMVAQVAPDLPIYFLDTGKHFPETLAYFETLRQRLGLGNVIPLHPDPADLVRFDPKGDLWSSDPDSCCHIRKTEPLDAVVKGFAGWITGRKRHQTAERQTLMHFEAVVDGGVKVNPLAFFTEADIRSYKLNYGLPEHPLYPKGYTSIGCAPCTSVVAAGEDPRAGRWRGTGKKECGIHIEPSGAVVRPMSLAEPLAELTLFKDGAFRADPFRAWREDDTSAGASYVHVPLPVFIAQREAFLASPHPLGLLVAPGDQVELVAGDLWRFASVAVDFPAFTDGRGYSSARFLAERYGFAGELRAVGDVLMDQIPLMRRCGITAFVVKHEPTRRALESGRLTSVDLFYQPVGRTEVPVGTRPFLRRAVATA